MTIPVDKQIEPLAKPQASLPMVESLGAGGRPDAPQDQQGGRMTEPTQALLQQWRDFISGMARLIPCEASGKNLITLTPLSTAPIPDGFRDYDIYVAKATQTSDGAVTATVVPENGTFATVKVYKTNGAAQAGAGDIVTGSVYLFVFADHLDSGAGGLIAK